MNDSKKQREFRDYYDKTDYFDRFQEHYGTEDSAFNLYARRYIFSIYYPKRSERVADLGEADIETEEGEQREERQADQSEHALG